MPPSQPLKVLSSRDVNTLKAPQVQKKKERASSLCKTPPQLIRNGNMDFRRGQFLGEGGFARCFLVKDTSGQVFAAKTIAKASLSSQRIHHKLLTEIKIHKSMSHPNIVKFVDCFEDTVNVYILLEICTNQSLNDMVKARKRLTAAEVRFFTVQILGAVEYMHRRRVVHRDLKLGNVFLDSHMNVKIGDFGLASVLASDRERKKTICGTPNYIAPEILGGEKVGHRFEVDIWAVGVIVYTMLFGRPPFQAKDVAEIYERIKKNDYSIPTKYVTDGCDLFVKYILVPDPAKRPVVDDLICHPFMCEALFPATVPKTALKQQPVFRGLDSDKSRRHFMDALHRSSLDHLIAIVTAVTADRAHIVPTTKSTCTPANAATNGTNSSAGSAPVKITADDLDPKSGAVLPTSLSPASTKDKYRMVLVDNRNPKLQLNLKQKEQHRLLHELQDTRADRISRQYRFLTKAIIEYIESDVIVPKLPLVLRKPVTFISKWIDFNAKYGLGFELTDRTVGLLFKDGQVLVSDEFEEDFILYMHDETADRWIGEHVSDYVPSATFSSSFASPLFSPRRRIKLLHEFHKYMDTELKGSNIYTEPHGSPDFIAQFIRNKKYVAFETRKGNWQINFPDHIKLILSQNCRQVDLLDAHGVLHTWDMQEALSFGKLAEADNDTDSPAYNIYDRLKVCREIVADQLAVDE